MAFIIHEANAARVFATVAAQYSKTPAKSIFVSSGFLNPENVKSQTTIPATYEVLRTAKARSVEMVKERERQDGVAFEKGKRASNLVKKVASSHESGTGFVRSAFTWAEVHELISAEGSTNAEQKLIGALNEHYAQVVRGMDRRIFNSIIDNHQVKEDGDQLGMDGATVDFATDSGRTPYNAKVDLTTIDNDTQYKILEDLETAFTGGADTDVSLLDAGDPLYVLLPRSVYRKYASAFSRGRKWSTTGRSHASDGTSRIGVTDMFTADGIIFCAVPNDFFTKKDVNLIPSWECYILPCSAMSYYIPVTPLGMAFRYNNTQISDAVIARAMFANNNGDGIMNDRSRFAALENDYVNIDSDPVLLSFLKAPMSSIYYSSRFEFCDLDPSTEETSKATTFECVSEATGVRARPHFIQTYMVAETLAPHTSAAGGAAMAAASASAMSSPAASARK